MKLEAYHMGFHKGKASGDFNDGWQAGLAKGEEKGEERGFLKGHAKGLAEGQGLHLRNIQFVVEAQFEENLMLQVLTLQAKEQVLER